MDVPPGHPKRELTWDDLEAKFLDCADSCGVARTTAHSAFADLRDLGNVADISRLAERLTIPGADASVKVGAV